MMERYYAHLADDGRAQAVEEHLEGTAQKAALFAQAFGAGDYGYLAGMSHDIGKYSEGFQQRLRGGPKVDHSSAGALECAAAGEFLVGMCVAGHHGGLTDFGNDRTDRSGDPTFIGRMKKVLPFRAVGYPGWQGKLPKTPPEPGFDQNGYYRSLWGRFLFSSLVDADFLDTEAFMAGRPPARGGYDSLPVLLERLHTFTARWAQPASELNLIRNEIYKDCINAAEMEKGLFSLTVPTGGGKTISSLAFALAHAVRHKMDRIIYVIPYTSIIEQNAAVFRSVLGDHNVLEHHSEAEYNETDDIEDGGMNMALAAENWDAPVVVTTAVQFFESLYSNRVSKCRKLHNIANSVIIFDEAQMLPTSHLLPCVAAIGTLAEYFSSSVVLCTATQPFISDLLSDYAPKHQVREICRDTELRFEKLKRTSYVRTGKKSEEELASELAGYAQVLCIVNTRKSAQTLFRLLPEEGRYHLSTLMHPNHRKSILQTVRERLAAGLPCRVVSTSLIEAGVDVDFPAVFRELAGLDSIVQAAGRCNREGKRSAESSTVTVFELEKAAPPLIRVNIGAANEAIRICPDMGSPAAIKQYFVSLRDYLKDGIDKTDAVRYLSEGHVGCLLPYKYVADRFRLIDNNTNTVYIRCPESEPLVQALADGHADRSVYRAAGGYSVQIYERHYAELLAAGDIVEFAPGQAYLENLSLYDMETGLSLEAQTGKAVFL